MIHVKCREEPPVHIKTNATVTVSDGGYERGYAAGHEVGYTKGFTAGLAERSYETWTLTLVDGTIVEKEVALL